MCLADVGKPGLEINVVELGASRSQPRAGHPHRSRQRATPHAHRTSGSLAQFTGNTPAGDRGRSRAKTVVPGTREAHWHVITEMQKGLAKALEYDSDVADDAVPRQRSQQISNGRSTATSRRLPQAAFSARKRDCFQLPSFSCDWDAKDPSCCRVIARSRSEEYRLAFIYPAKSTEFIGRTSFATGLSQNRMAVVRTVLLKCTHRKWVSSRDNRRGGQLNYLLLASICPTLLRVEAH